MFEIYSNYNAITRKGAEKHDNFLRITRPKGIDYVNTTILKPKQWLDTTYKVAAVVAVLMGIYNLVDQKTEPDLMPRFLQLEGRTDSIIQAQDSTVTVLESLSEKVERLDSLYNQNPDSSQIEGKPN